MQFIINVVVVLSVEQRDAAEHHEQGEERRAVHRGRAQPRQEGREEAAQPEESG